jgi:RNA polymerase sigma factor (sigma-70 family)
MEDRLHSSRSLPVEPGLAQEGHQGLPDQRPTTDDSDAVVRLERLANDARRAALAAGRFTGPGYVVFEEELANYGIASSAAMTSRRSPRSSVTVPAADLWKGCCGATARRSPQKAMRRETAMTRRHDESDKGNSVEQIARLVELSSFGTVGARQLRDRTRSVSRDRALLQAYFSATAEGGTWWRMNGKNPDALYDAAKSFAADGPEERMISGRLMGLAAALGHSKACAIISGDVDERQSDACAACTPCATEGLPQDLSNGADLQVRRADRPSSGSGMDWRSFEEFFAKFLDPLTVTLSAEMSLRAERSRAVLLQAMKAAFDNWEDISTAGRPEEWVLGYAVEQQRYHLIHEDCVWYLVFDGCSHTRPGHRRNRADSGADEVFRDIDVRITGALVTAVQSKVRTDAYLPSQVTRLVVECKRYLTTRHVQTMAELSSLTDLDEAITGFYIHQYRSVVHLATLLVGETDHTEEIAVAAFDAARRAWRQSYRSYDETVSALRQSLINQTRAVNRFYKTRKLAQQPGVSQREPTGEDGTPQEFSPVVLTALQRLTVRQREALALRYYADLDITQIADAMGVSPPAARMHMMRGTQKLRLILGELYTPPDSVRELSGDVCRESCGAGRHTPVRPDPMQARLTTWSGQ